MEPEKAAETKAGSQVCRFCGATMPAEAVRCNACELRQDWVKQCINCAALLAESARYCPSCESYQARNRECVSCGVYIPVRAKICPKCSSVQIFGGLLNISQVTLSLLIALITVIAAVGPKLQAAVTPNCSETHIELVGMDEDFRLVLLVSNKGNRPSYLRNARIDFTNLPQASQELSIVGKAEERVLGPGSQKILRLESVPGFSLSDLGFQSREDRAFQTKFLNGGHVLNAEVVGTGEEQKQEAKASPEILKEFVERRAG